MMPLPRPSDPRACGQCGDVTDSCGCERLGWYGVAAIAVALLLARAVGDVLAALGGRL